MPTQTSYDFNKEDVVWFDIGYAFFGKKKDQKHGYPITSRGPVLAVAIFAVIVIIAIAAAYIF